MPICINFSDKMQYGKESTEKNHGKRKKNPYLCFLQSAVPHLAHAEFGTGIKICNIKI